MSNQNKHSNGYRNFVLVLLTLVYGFNFIDRQIVGILAPFIQKDLGLTNTEMGLLTGLLFAALYTVVAILFFLVAKLCAHRAGIRGLTSLDS